MERLHTERSSSTAIGLQACHHEDGVVTLLLEQVRSPHPDHLLSHTQHGRSKPSATPSRTPTLSPNSSLASNSPMGWPNPVSTRNTNVTRPYQPWKPCPASSLTSNTPFAAVTQLCRSPELKPNNYLKAQQGRRRKEWYRLGGHRPHRLSLFHHYRCSLWYRKFEMIRRRRLMGIGCGCWRLRARVLLWRYWLCMFSVSEHGKDRFFFTNYLSTINVFGTEPCVLLFGNLR